VRQVLVHALLRLVIYTDLTFPTRMMVWLRWIISPIGHAFETVLVVESKRRVFNSLSFNMTYNYDHSLVWRNFGISIGCMVFFCGTNFLANEKIAAVKPEGKVLVLRRSRLPERRNQHVDGAAGGAKSTERNSVGSDYTVAVIQPLTEIFHWNDVCSDIKNKKEDRRLLDNVCWVKPDTRP
ncbi:hypothetical protein GGG16DRAFT_107054, partial [Schizophyllum commune]